MTTNVAYNSLFVAEHIILVEGLKTNLSNMYNYVHKNEMHHCYESVNCE